MTELIYTMPRKAVRAFSVEETVNILDHLNQRVVAIRDDELRSTALSHAMQLALMIGIDHENQVASIRNPRSPKGAA